MKKSKTTFEQVPVSLAKKIATAEMSLSSNFVFCVLCGHAVALEKCKVDENGGPVHENCYLAKTIGRADHLKLAPTPKPLPSL